jgi:hypothetical protein
MKKKRKNDPPRQTAAQKYATWIVVGVLVLLIAPGAFFVAKTLLSERRQSRAAAPFEEHINEYLTAPKAGAPTNQKARGKFITVDVNERRVDRLYFELPPELRAASPDEVATVVWLDWREEKVGEYSGGKPACVEWCDVTVIDRQQNVTLAKKQFKGGDPPKTLKTTFIKGVGPRPYKEIADYLASLCRG